MMKIPTKFIQVPSKTLKRLDGSPVMITIANTRIATGSKVKQLSTKHWIQRQNITKM